MIETLPSLFDQQAASRAHQPLFFVKHHGRYQPIFWGQARQDVAALGTFFLASGVNPGDRVLILSENRPEWGIADLAIQSIGAWTVPIYATLTAQDLCVICRDCQPVLAIASTADQAAKLLAVRHDVPSLRLMITMVPVPDAQLVTWSEALARGRDAAAVWQATLEQRQRQLRPEDPATLIYTSGTTGEPKGVMLSHRNLLSNVEAGLHAIPITETDVHLSFLPLSHVFERMAGWYLMLRAGAAVAYAETMDTIPQNMLEVRPTVMLGVPRFFEKLYARMREGIEHLPPPRRQLVDWAIRVGKASAGHTLQGRPLPFSLAWQRQVAHRLVFKKFQARLGGRLRFFVSGGAPLAKEIGEFFYHVGVTILEGYGLTETSPVITVNRLDALRFGSVGKVLPGVEVKIADDGEILTRGPHVMLGYYQKPLETAAVIVNQWFHTGDIGCLDADGFLCITDRKKDLIKTAGGKFIAPQRLENLLVTDPYISQAFVYGDKQPYCVALIVPQMEQLHRYAQEQEIGAQSLHDLLHDARIQEFYWRRVQARQEGLASFEQVKKIALLDQEFSQAAGELTPTLKAKRQLIAQRHDTLLRELYQSPAA